MKNYQSEMSQFESDDPVLFYTEVSQQLSTACHHCIQCEIRLIFLIMYGFVLKFLILALLNGAKFPNWIIDCGSQSQYRKRVVVLSAVLLYLKSNAAITSQFSQIQQPEILSSFFPSITQFQTSFCMRYVCLN